MSPKANAHVLENSLFMNIYYKNMPGHLLSQESRCLPTSTILDGPSQGHSMA